MATMKTMATVKSYENKCATNYSISLWWHRTPHGWSSERISHSSMVIHMAHSPWFDFSLFFYFFFLSVPIFHTFCQAEVENARKESRRKRRKKREEEEVRRAEEEVMKAVLAISGDWVGYSLTGRRIILVCVCGRHPNGRKETKY